MAQVFEPPVLQRPLGVRGSHSAQWMAPDPDVAAPWKRSPPPGAGRSWSCHGHVMVMSACIATGQPQGLATCAPAAKVVHLTVGTVSPWRLQVRSYFATLHSRVLLLFPLSLQSLLQHRQISGLPGCSISSHESRQTQGPKSWISVGIAISCQLAGNLPGK